MIKKSGTELNCNKSWKSLFVKAGLYSLLTFALCVFSSGIAGRALGGDEILRVFGSKMSLTQLFAFEHLKTFCTQTPTAYLFIRPFQLVFGVENGAYLLVSLCGAGITFVVLMLLTFLNKKQFPKMLTALIVSSNPLLIFYGSELAFYILWGVAFAFSFAFLIALDSSQLSRKTYWLCLIGLIISSTAFVSFHFAGMFIWGTIAGCICLILLFREGLTKAIKAGLVFLLPALFNIVMYIGAMRVPDHLGPKTIQTERISELIPLAWKYFSNLYDKLCGGWYLGAILLVVGAVALLIRRKKDRYIAILSLVSILSIFSFLSYTNLREYTPIVSRYWVYALAPVLLLIGQGMETLLDKKRSILFRYSGLFLGTVVLVVNLAIDIALIDVDGRPRPLKKMQQELVKYPSGLIVVSVNNYAIRFLGQYYPLLNYGQMTSPCFWESGRKVRVDGIRKIRALKPDTMIYLDRNADVGEANEAGINIPGDGIVYQWSWLLRQILEFDLFPEPVIKNWMCCQFAYDSFESLATISEEENKVLVVPEMGWKLARFRNSDGSKIIYALIAGISEVPSYNDRCSIKLYVPEVLSDVESWILSLDVLAYQKAPLKISLNDKVLYQIVLNTPPASENKFVYLRNRQVYSGLPPVEHIVRNGDFFVVIAKPIKVSLTLPKLNAGWNNLKLSFPLGTKWMLTEHELKPKISN